jgi:PAS domain S-box-containing protein
LLTITAFILAAAFLCGVLYLQYFRIKPLQQKLIDGEQHQRDILNTAIFNQQRLELALETGNEGLWDWNILTGEIHFSQTLVLMLGYEIAEIEPHIASWKALIHPDDSLHAAHSLEDYLRGDLTKYLVEYRVLKKDGSWLWIMDRGRIIERHDELNMPTHMVGIQSDVTRFIDYENAITRRNDFMEHLTDSMGEGVFSVDRNGDCIFINPKALEILGYQRHEILHQNIHDLIHSHSECGKKILRSDCGSKQATLSGNRFESESEAFIRKDGSFLPVAMTSEPLYDYDKITGSVTVFSDITVRKLTEQSLLQAQHKAEDAAKSKARFLSTMSHEIRTPMNGMLGMAQLLSDTSLSNDQKLYVDTIRNSGNNLLIIINNILECAKLDAKKVQAEDILFNLKKLGQDALALLIPESRKKGFAVVYDYSANCHQEFYGDPTRIRQIISNLLSNAAKFTESGTITLKISCSPETNEKHPDTLIEIADTGIGIKPSSIENLFQEFTQAEQDTTRKYGGTGLGLAICKKLVTLMSGEIGVHSTEGQGSIFWIKLPLASQPNSHTDNSPSPETQPIINLQTIQQIKTDIGETDYRDVIQSVLQSIEEVIQTLAEHESDPTITDLLRHLQSIKSPAAYLGTIQLLHIVETIEKQIHDNDLTDGQLSDPINTLKGHYQDTKTHLQSVLQD